jgi:hypothetical protein
MSLVTPAATMDLNSQAGSDLRRPAEIAFVRGCKTV